MGGQSRAERRVPRRKREQVGLESDLFNIGPLESLVVAAVALLIVGPKRLPEIGRTIGKSLREFRRLPCRMSAIKGKG